MLAPRPRQLVALAFTALFLLGVGSEGYGWHDCPHHHRDGQEQVSGVAAGDRAQLRDAGRSGAPVSGRCTCVGSCHAGATAPVPASTVPGPLPGDRAHRVPAADGSPFVPRSPDQYFLPFPNGPPTDHSRAVQA